MVTSAIYPYYRKAGILTDDCFHSTRIKQVILRDIVRFHRDRKAVPKLTCTRELCEQNWNRIPKVNIKAVWEGTVGGGGNDAIGASLRKLIWMGTKKKSGVVVPMVKSYLDELTNKVAVITQEMADKIVRILNPHFAFVTQIKQPGAFVYPVEPGFYEKHALTVFDFASLYPSLAQSNNIGEDTRIGLEEVLERRDSIVLWEDVICTKVNYDVDNQDLNNPDKKPLFDRALTIKEALRQMREEGAEFEFHLTKKHKEAVRLEFFRDLSALRGTAKKHAETLKQMADHFACVQSGKESMLTLEQAQEMAEKTNVSGCLEAVVDPTKCLSSELVDRVMEAYRIYSSRSAAIKVINNSHYGTTTHQYCSSVTRTITGSGREATMNAARYLVQYRQRWIPESKIPVIHAGDTDSIFGLLLPMIPIQVWEFWLRRRKLFVKNLGPVYLARLEDILRKRDGEPGIVKGLLVQSVIDQHFCDELNAYSEGRPPRESIYLKPMKLEMERSMVRLFFATKKHYVGMEFKPNSCTFKQVIKGVDLKRRNTSELVRKLQRLFFDGLQQNFLNEEKPSLIKPYQLMASTVADLYQNNCGDDLKLIAKRLTRLQAPKLYERIMRRKDVKVAALTTTHVLALPLKREKKGPINWETLERVEKMKKNGQDVTKIVDVEKIVKGFFKTIWEWTEKICPEKKSKAMQELSLQGGVGPKELYENFELPPPIFRTVYEAPVIPTGEERTNYLSEMDFHEDTGFKKKNKKRKAAVDEDSDFKKKKRR